jgi:hypothetical protein
MLRERKKSWANENKPQVFKIQINLENETWFKLQRE